MATTRIIPMHLNKGKTLAQCLADRTEYGMNPDKTEGGALISAFACEPETAVSEFALSKREYRELTGRVQESDVIAYQVRQSFKPGEVTPEEANRIGYEFAQRFLKGEHAFLVCTHTDKKHIHNHIYWNSTALDCTKKFKNFIGSYRAVRRLSDLICAEHRLSVVENPQKHGLSYNKWRGGHDKLSNRDLLRMAIDAALEKQPQDFDALLALLRIPAIPSPERAGCRCGTKTRNRASAWSPWARDIPSRSCAPSLREAGRTSPLSGKNIRSAGSAPR